MPDEIVQKKPPTQSVQAFLGKLEFDLKLYYATQDRDVQDDVYDRFNDMALEFGETRFSETETKEIADKVGDLRQQYGSDPTVDSILALIALAPTIDIPL